MNNNIFTKSYSKSDNSEYQQEILELLEYLAFNPIQKNGFAFISGLTLPISCTKTSYFDYDSIKDNNVAVNEYVNSILSMFSDGNFNIEEYEEIDITPFREYIYNFNFIQWKCLLKSEENLDDYLKQIPELGIIVGKTNLDNNWVEKYFEENYNLKNANSLYYDLIEKIGTYLFENNVSIKESYDFGVALYFHLIKFDIQGTHLLISTISNKMPPLFSFLKEYPILYTFHNDAIKANHVFSSIFHFFTFGMDINITGPIHKFHQIIFYENGSINLKDDWDFSKKDRNSLIDLTFLNAQSIRVSNLYSLKPNYIESPEIYGKHLINNSYSVNDFKNEILLIIENKYGYTANLNELRSKGEFIEFIAMIYYETCLHAMVVDDLTA